MPDRVIVPAPVLVRPPVPERDEASVTLLPLVSNVAPPAPQAASCDEMSALLPVAHCSPPPSIVMGPVPKLFAELKLMKPPVMVVRLEYELLPVRMSVPTPALLRVPRPE